MLKIKLTWLWLWQKIKDGLILTSYAISDKRFNEAAEEINAITKSLSTTLHSVAYLLLIIGIGLLVLSFKNEDANSKDKGIMSLCVAAILWGIDTLIL